MIAVRRWGLVWVVLAIGVAGGWLRRAEAGPIVLYHFDEGSGTIVHNAGSLGSAANGTMSGGVSFSTDTPLGSGNSLAFDGSSGFVSVPDAWDYTNQVTVQAWIRPDRLTGQQVIWDDYGNPGVLLALYGNEVQFNISTTSQPGLGLGVYAGGLVVGQWQHIAGVYDGSTMKVYVNGILVGSTSDTGTIIDNTAGTPAGIGRDNASPALYYKGKLDEFQIDQTALTQNELANGAFAVPEPATIVMGGMATLLGAISLLRGRRSERG